MNEPTTQSELQAVLDTIVDGVIMIDDKGIIERYNPACTEIFGYSTDEVIGQNISFLMPEPYHFVSDCSAHLGKSCGR